MKQPPITVFTKPWQKLTLEELADLIKGLGFDGIELPVRPGFQVEPDSILQDYRLFVALSQSWDPQSPLPAWES